MSGSAHPPSCGAWFVFGASRDRRRVREEVEFATRQGRWRVAPGVLRVRRDRGGSTGSHKFRNYPRVEVGKHRGQHRLIKIDGAAARRVGSWIAGRRDAGGAEGAFVQRSNLVDGVERADPVRDVVQGVAFLRGDRRHRWLCFCEFSGGPRPAARPVFCVLCLLHTPFVWPSSALFATAAFRSAAICTGELPHSVWARSFMSPRRTHCLLRIDRNCVLKSSHTHPLKLLKMGGLGRFRQAPYRVRSPAGRVAWRRVASRLLVSACASQCPSLAFCVSGFNIRLAA